MPSLCTEFTSPEAMERLGHEVGQYPTPEKGKQIRGIRRRQKAEDKLKTALERRTTETLSGALQELT